MSSNGLRSASSRSAVAYGRMLGSLSEADDAVQEAKTRGVQPAWPIRLTGTSAGPAVAERAGQPRIERVGIVSSPAQMGIGTHEHDVPAPAAARRHTARRQSTIRQRRDTTDLLVGLCQIEL
jgi:hypothetical protein